MTRKVSAGILMYKFDKDGKLRVFIAHPGGPFWKGKDDGCWGIPKGEVKDGEDLLQCAIREMKEETGIDPNGKKLIELGSIKQKSGKVVHCWAFEGDWSGLLMGTSFIEMEFPNGSGKKIKFPELDKAGFFSLENARKMLNEAQAEFISRLEQNLKKE